MPKVGENAVCLETHMDAIRQVLFCLTEYDSEEDGDAEEDGEQCGGQDRSLLDTVGNGKAA